MKFRQLQENDITLDLTPRERAIQRMMAFDGCDRIEAERRWSKMEQRRNGILVNGKRLTRF
jgi:hypothetical protein